jgi:hypothetical protein
MSPVLEFITWPNVLLGYAVASVLWGIPLLWRYLSHQPITRHRAVYTAWNIAIVGPGLTIGNAITTAHERGMISLLTTAIAVAIWFAVFGGGSSLLERWYPEEPHVRPPA